jgi:hypothetical protein
VPCVSGTQSHSVGQDSVTELFQPANKARRLIIGRLHRITRKLREHKAALDSCIAAVVTSLHAEMPTLGENVAIDGSDLPAYANGQNFLYNHGPERQAFSDPDASWRHRSAIATRRGGRVLRLQVHAAGDAASGLPLSWVVATAKNAEVPLVPVLLDKLGYGIRPSVAIADKGDDAGPTTGCEARGIRPVVPLLRLRS